MDQKEISQQLVLDIGKAIGKLEETNKSVQILSDDLKKYIESHEITRTKCIEHNTKNFENLGKKIDDHVNIDHVENIKFMNWFMTLKKNALYIVIGLVGVLFMVIAPDSVRDEVYRAVQFIRQLI